MTNDFIPFTEKLDPEDIGNEICNELCWRSFLEDIEKDDDFYYGKRFKMHDLVHDLAQSIMEDECFSKEFESSTDISKRTCHFTYVDEYWNSYPPFPEALYQVENLRTFLVLTSVGKKKGCHLAELKDLNLGGYLRIKHLQRVVNPTNAKEANLIGKRNLRRLSLSWKDDDGDLESPEDAEKVLEALEPHANLEHFVISGYKGVQFPFWMRNHILNNVVYLSLSDCHNCSHLPPLSLLASLRNLHLSRISRVMYIDDNFQGAGIMRGFPSLQELRISDLPSLQRFSREDGVELLPCLTSLNIFRCPKLTLPRLPSVTELHVSDCNEVLLGSISNLKSLTLLKVSKNNKLIDLPKCMLLNLTSLNQLYISYFSKLKCLPKELVGLSALETLDISCCDEFESFPEQGMEGLKSLKNLQLHECRKFTTLSEGLQLLSCLEKLTLTGCPELVALPDGIKYLNSLKHLEISGDRIKIQSWSHNPCGFEPVYIWSFNREEPIGSPKLAVLPEALRYVPALQSLYISSYPNLASLPHWLGDLKSLQTLLINDCPKLSSLPESMQGLTKLQKLVFWGCPELVKQCEKETGEDWSYLSLSWAFGGGFSLQGNVEGVLEALEPHPNLEYLAIRQYKELPPLGHLPSLCSLKLHRISGVLYIDHNLQGGRMMRRFSSLESLTIRDLLNLERLLREEGREILPCLISLEIQNCPNLTFSCLPSLKFLEVLDCYEELLRSISNLSSLTSLRLYNNNELICLPQGMLQNLTSLESLVIKYFNKLKEIPTGLNSINALESISICHCNELESFPEQSPEGLNCLKKLCITECRKFTSLPDGLQYLSSLESLTLSCCPELVSLPNEALQHVAALQSLHISGYPDLASLPHWLGDLTSLHSLIIVGCPKLSSLPASIQSLTNLQELVISQCPELIKRCKKEIGEDWYKIAHVPYVYVDPVALTEVEPSPTELKFVPLQTH
ncbi:hypothetical protein LWI28_006189 [Acer negundo]|uniref:Uncharacterized protein n=1 Tax=Acer negundo TaxID=4023 RepID=A0AAD5JNI1_ACENE|nr:hypothetical protein LWI28_006189 [Acer negundo]